MAKSSGDSGSSCLMFFLFFCLHLQLGLILGSGMALFVKVLYKSDDSSNQRRIFNSPIPVETA